MARHGPEALKAAVLEPVGGHGGMDYYDSGLCEGLSEAGVEVTLYTCDETARDTAAPYGTKLVYRGIYGKDPAWLRGLRYLRGSVRALAGARLGGTRVAHLHLFHVGPMELFDALFAKLLGMKVVVSAHDVQSFVERLSVPWMVRAVYRAADRVIAHSKVAERELKASGVPGSKIERIPHGNYLRSIDKVPSKEEARDGLGLPHDTPVILFFGQIKAVKGLDVLLEAMPAVIRSHPDALLLVAGKVWKDDLRRYREQIERLGIRESCTLHVRYIPDSEVAGYYMAADVIALPYRRIYQSGVLLMAMSYAKPVIASDVEGMSEVITDGENGYTFADGDPEALANRLAGALSDPEELRRVGQRALSYVKERHDWADVGRMTAACYRAALEGG